MERLLSMYTGYLQRLCPGYVTQEPTGLKQNKTKELLKPLQNISVECLFVLSKVHSLKHSAVYFYKHVSPNKETAAQELHVFEHTM